MIQTGTIAAPVPWQTPSWERVFLFLVGALASTILLKIAQIQYLELLYVLEMVVLWYGFSKRDYRTRWFRPFLHLLVLDATFCVVAVLLSIASLRLDFYFPPGLGLMRYPVVIAALRASEVLASVFFMVYLSELFRNSLEKLRFCMRVYFWTGVASTVYSIVSYPLDVTGLWINLGTYSIDHRMRGFYNEGGPYGLYVISVVLVGFTLYRMDWEFRRRLWIGLALLFVAFVMSGSKAGFFAAATMALVNLVLVRGAMKRLALLLAGIAGVMLVLQVVDIGRAVRLYQRSSANYERLSHLHRGDVNFVLGRVAGAFVVPRMVAAHPWTGIGWGNYGTLRNAPEYRGASAWTNIDDDPGLGVLGASADFGLPLLAYLLVCLVLPFLMLRRRRSPVALTNLALLQPIAHLFGAQLNLTYPWVTTAFALGLAFSKPQAHNVDVPSTLIEPNVSL